MKKQISIVLSSLGMLLAGCSFAFANDWQNTQFPGFNTQTLHSLSITADINGIPYFAFTDNDYDGKVRIQKYQNSALSEVGTAGSLNYTDGEIMINPVSNQLYFFGYNDDEVSLLKFNGSSWEVVGYNICEYGGKFNFDPVSGTPYVLCSNDAGAIVKKFEGSSWENVGATVEDDGYYYADIAFNPLTQEPYVVFTTDNGDDVSINVKKYSGGSWTLVGSANFDNVWEYSNVKIMVDGLGNPYISYFSYSGSNLVGHLKKYDGSSWQEVGDTSFMTNSSDYDPFLDFYINPQNNVPFVFYGVYKYEIENGFCHTKKYDGSSWVNMDINLLSGLKNSGYKNGKVAISKTGDIFVAYDWYTFSYNNYFWSTYFIRNSYIESNKKSMTASKSNPIQKRQIRITVPQVTVRTKAKWVIVKLNTRRLKVLKASRSGNNLVVTAMMRYKKWTKGFYNLTLTYKYKQAKRMHSNTVTSPSFLYIY